VLYRSWEQLTRLTDAIAGGASNESRLPRELARCLRGLVNMQNQRDNMVYVVALGWDGPADWSPVSPRAIVFEQDRYFHPRARAAGPRSLPTTLASASTAFCSSPATSTQSRSPSARATSSPASLPTKAHACGGSAWTVERRHRGGLSGRRTCWTRYWERTSGTQLRGRRRARQRYARADRNDPGRARIKIPGVAHDR
jgi:hypothetical protein